MDTGDEKLGGTSTDQHLRALAPAKRGAAEPNPRPEPIFLLFNELRSQTDGWFVPCGVIVPQERAWKMLERARKSPNCRNPRLIAVTDQVVEVEHEEQIDGL